MHEITLYVIDIRTSTAHQILQHLRLRHMLDVLIYNNFTTNPPQRSFPAHFLQNPGDQILVGPSHPTHFERVMLVEVSKDVGSLCDMKIARP